ncbi:heavy-metal-associated domain-containing protein [Neobacillus niacini]|uniref:heavy-metal-associated domain-containing protein n=1 Tax=Neobacillus niacini TaxID=86668 RepID=UPI00285AE27A|nr:heavy-metal-associated domain-containing protein [Neobacillus niacini]MDR6997719.1 copper chaperone CopZ [Neobacillus niacini]
MKKAVFQLEPLTCPSCIKKIETALRKKAGVDSVKVLFNFGKVKTEFDEVQVEVAQLEETIKKLGYLVLSTKVS